MAIYKIKILDKNFVKDNHDRIYRDSMINFPKGKVPVLFGVSLNPWAWSELSIVDEVLYATFDTKAEALKPYMKLLHNFWLLPEGKMSHNGITDISRPMDGCTFSMAFVERVVLSPSRHADGFKSIGEQIDEQDAEGVLLDEDYVNE